MGSNIQKNKCVSEIKRVIRVTLVSTVQQDDFNLAKHKKVQAPGWSQHLPSSRLRSHIHVPGESMLLSCLPYRVSSTFVHTNHLFPQVVHTWTASHDGTVCRYPVNKESMSSCLLRRHIIVYKEYSFLELYIQSVVSHLRNYSQKQKIHL